MRRRTWQSSWTAPETWCDCGEVRYTLGHLRWCYWRRNELFDCQGQYKFKVADGFMIKQWKGSIPFFSVVCLNLSNWFVCLSLFGHYVEGRLGFKWNWFLFMFLICFRFFFVSDHNNRTALHVAAMRGSKRCVECILKHHPQSINLLDKNQVSSHGVQCCCLRNRCQVRIDKIQLWVKRFLLKSTSLFAHQVQ